MRLLTIGQEVRRQRGGAQVGRVEYLRRPETITRLGEVLQVARPVKVRWPDDPPNVRRWHAPGDLVGGAR